MKQTLAVIILVLLSGAGEISAQPTYEFSVNPVVGMRFGYTRFEIDFNYLLADSSVGSGGSELVFPLEVKQGGVQFGFRVMEAGHRLWTADLRLLFAISDPGSKMSDRDWIVRNPGILEFSSTQSTVDGSLTELEFEATRLLTSGESSELAVLAGISSQKVKQRMVDLSGWQAYYGTFEDDELAGTYEVRYVRPQIGLMPRFLFNPFTLEVKAVVSPLLSAKDVDDHVRRYFQIRTDGRGFGYGGRVALQYEPSPEGKSSFLGRLSAEASRTTMDVTGYREYYADNPDEGAVKGDRYSEEHTLSSTQYGIHLAVGIRF